VKFDPATNIFTFHPMERSQIGDHSIMVSLIDYHGEKYSESF